MIAVFIWAILVICFFLYVLVCTMKTRDRKQQRQWLLDRWDAFYTSSLSRHEAMETADWESMAVGFFIALGADVETAIELAEQYNW